MRGTFVTWATTIVFAAAIAVPGLGWLAFPVVAPFVKAMINWGANVISKAAVMEAFFLNTSIRKAAQAQDYIDAVTAKNLLPETATFEEYYNAEKAEMLAFSDFVRLTN